MNRPTFLEDMMRRKEFETTDRDRMDEVLKTAEVGTLAFNGADGWPRLTPVNFIYDGRILWHGSLAGERAACLKQDSRATFSTVASYLYIPSHFLSEESAASATAVFQSVLVRGRVQPIEDPLEKCSVLNRVMEKYQPEGKFRKITPQESLYQKVLQATGVYALSIDEISAKFKFAQNKSREEREKIIAVLKSRNAPADLKVAEEIRKTLS